MFKLYIPDFRSEALLRLLFSFLGLFFLSISANHLLAQCQKTGPYQVEPFDVFEFTVAIDSIAVDDLADPLQGLCAVSIEYEHQSVADMLIELESPAGQLVTLVGPIANADLTFFTQWNISFLPCSATPDPDLDFGDSYSNLYSWGVLGEANGSYHPFSGCLEDFDTGPVTGEWTVKVRDQGLFYEGEIQSITLFFCDPTGLECLDCAVPENQFQADSAVICSNMPSATPAIDTASNFDSSFHQNAFLIQDSDSIISYSNSISFDSIAFGTYDLCLWTLEKGDSAAFFSLIDTIQNPDSLQSAVEQSGICAVNGGCTFVNWVDNSDTLFLDTATCAGEDLVFMGDTLTVAGSYTFFDTTGLCPQTIQLEYLIRDPVAVLSELDTINCARDSIIADADSSVTADSTSFRWENSDGLLLGTEEQIPLFEGGEYVLIVSDGLCSDSLEFSVEDQRALPYFDISGDSTITCSRDSAVLFVDSVESGAQYYWVLNNETLDRDTLVLRQADTIQFVVIGANSCLDSQTIVIAEDFRQPEFQIDTNIVLCPGDSVPLSPVFDTLANYGYIWYGPDSFQSSKRDTFTNIPGLYVLQATHPETGCQKSDSLSLEESPLPNMPQVSSDTLGCLQRSVTPNLDTTMQGWIYFWITPEGDTLFEPEPEVNLPGEYILWVNDPSACSDSLLFSVAEAINFPRYDILLDTLSCIDEDATLAVDFLTDPDGFQFSWEDPLGRTFDSISIVTALPGSYIFRLSNGDFCETADTVSLVEDFTPFDHVLKADTISCFQENVELTITGGRDNFDFQWSGPDGFSGQGDTLTISNPGPYVAAIESVNCFYERGIIVEADTSKPAFQFDLFPINCERDTGRIRFSDSSLSRLELFDPDSMDFISLPRFSYPYTEEGSRRFQLVGNNGCTADSNIALTIDTLIPPISTNIDSFTCDQTQIKASWESQANIISSRWTQDGILVSSGDSLVTSQNTPIQLELQFENACRYDTILQPILDTVAPEVNINPQNLNCDRTSYQLAAEVMGEWRNFQWELPLGDSLDNSLSVLIENAGEYNWSITGTNGCVRTDSFSISQDTLLPVFQIQNTVIPCDQTNVNVIPEGDSTALAAFRWRAENGQSFDAWSPSLSEGSYTFIYEGQNSCKDSIDLEVISDQVEAQVSNLDSNYTLNCENPTRFISPRIDGMIDTAFWILPGGDRESGSNVTLAEPGRYQFLLRERNVCWDTISIEVALDTIRPTATLLEDTLSCNRAEVSLQAQIQARNPTYEWTGPGSFSSQERAPIIDRPGVYFLTVRDENGCFTMDSVRIAADLELPQVNLPDTFFQNCDRPIVQVSIDIESDEEVEWSRSGELISSQTQFEFEPGSWLLAAVKAANGCIATDSVFLSDQLRFPQADWQRPILACDNLEDTIRLLASSGDYEFIWSGPDNFTFNGPEPLVQEPGIYTVQYQNDAQCQTSDTLLIEASSQPPQFELVSDDTLRCLDSTATYQIQNSNPEDYDYNWTALSGEVMTAIDKPSAILRGPGQFVVTVQDIDSFCVSTDTLDLQFAAENDWTLSHRVYDQYCVEDSLNGITIFVPGNPDFRPFTYILQGDTIPVGDLQSLMPGDYEISVYDRQGCSGDISFSVADRSEEQNINIGEDRDVNLGDELSIVPDISVPQWQQDSLTWVVNTQDSCFNCNPFEWVIRGPMQIEASLTTLGGCVLTDVLNLLPPLEDLIFVPNIFSPNDDGVNDFFFVQTALEELTTIDQIQIFNRSGNLLFENRDFPPNARREGWNGMFRGQKQDPQVFAVLLKYTVEGKQRTEVHSLTLVH